jgi:hypothetical protein
MRLCELTLDLSALPPSKLTPPSLFADPTPSPSPCKTLQPTTGSPLSTLPRGHLSPLKRPSSMPSPSTRPAPPSTTTRSSSSRSLNKEWSTSSSTTTMMEIIPSIFMASRWAMKFLLSATMLTLSSRSSQLYIMGSGAGRYQGQALDSNNPMRRDTGEQTLSRRRFASSALTSTGSRTDPCSHIVLLQAYSWTVLRFVADNPGMCEPSPLLQR